MKHRTTLLLLNLALALSGQLATSAAPISTSFTYQGQLKNSGVPVNTPRDIQVTLYDNASSLPGGGQIGSPIVFSGQQVANGLFTLTLNFPDLTANNCQGRWLEIKVRLPGGPNFSTVAPLTPRVELLPTPFALQSLNACAAASLTGTLPAAQLSGSVPDARLSANVALRAGGNIFSGIQTFNSQIQLNSPAGFTQSAAGDFAIDAPFIPAGRFVVKESGNVGIGTVSPSRRLEVQGPGNLEIGLQSTDLGGRLWSLQSTRTLAGPLRAPWEGCFQIIDRTAGTPRLSILDNGNVGLGTITPGAKLHAVNDGGVGVFSGNLNPFGGAEFESNVRAPAPHAHAWFAESGNRVFSVGPGGKVTIGPDFSGTAQSSTLVTSAGALPITQGAETALASFGLTTGNNTSLGVRARRIAAGDGWQRTAIGLTFDVDNAAQAGGGLWLAPGPNVGDGNVGIGTATPQAKLDVADGDIRMSAGRTITSSGRLHIQANENLYLNPFGGAGDVVVGGGGGPGNLHVVGTANVCTLTIRGGCDLAEPFEMSGDEIPKGSLVVIDEDNAGKLKLAGQEYDTRVAGIISGANGVNPGISLHQEGVIEGGQNVALSGRVYALADASNGSIKPGDLLTSSSTPGHVMRVTEHVKAQGAIVGKAMSALKDGKGMVLVLVSLQ